MVIRAFLATALCAAFGFVYFCAFPAQAGNVYQNRSLLNKKAYACFKTAYLQLLRGEYSESLSTQKQAIQADNPKLLTLQYSGYSLLQGGAAEEGLKQLHLLLLKSKPSDADMTMFGQVCLQGGYLSLAEQWFRACIADSPSNVGAIVGLKKVGLAQKKQADKETAARAALDGNLPVNGVSQVVNPALQEALKTTGLGNNEVRNAWENYRGVGVLRR